MLFLLSVPVLLLHRTNYQVSGIIQVNHNKSTLLRKPLTASLRGADEPLRYENTEDWCLSRRRRQIVYAFLGFNGSFLAKSPRALANAPLDAISEEAIMRQLKAPTADKPRIPLPTQGSKPYTLEGQISLNAPASNLWLTASDTIILTVRSINDPTEATLAGAMLPVSRIRSFPVRFSLNEKNAVTSAGGSKESSLRKWKNALENDDMVVEVAVCSKSSVDEKRSAGENLLAFKDICTATNGSTLGGKGFAKLLKLNTGQGSNEAIVRAPVSVVLNEVTAG